MKLSLLIDLPDSPSFQKSRRMTPCEKAQKLIDAIKSANGDAETEWEVLVETYKRLQCLPSLEGEMKKLFVMIHPVIDQFSRMDTNHGDMLQSTDYERWMSAHNDIEDKETQKPMGMMETTDVED